MVYPSTDANLVLVKNKKALLLVNVVTTNPSEAKPTGILSVEDTSGKLLRSIALTQPSDPIPATVSGTPSIAKTYSATIPADAVIDGVVFKIGLANGQSPTVVIPRIGSDNPITLVTVPVKIQTSVVDMPTDMAAFLLPRVPVAKVTEQKHAVFTSTAVTTFPADDDEWGTAMGKILSEMADLRTSESGDAHSYYYGFLPKTTYGRTGLGYVPGHAAVGVGRFSSGSSVALTTMVHELGHNFSLKHAPCGVSGDAQYPYANATLGGGGRYIWGYNLSTQDFIDPTDVSRHDIMSYCNGDSFSDYNYRKIQKYLNPADAFLVPAVKAMKLPQDLLLVSGEVSASGVKVNPLRAFRGVVQSSPAGSYVFRIESENGVFQYPFTANALDHDADLLMFSFSVPNPGQVRSISILQGGIVIYAKNAQTAGNALEKSTAQNVSVSEKNGVLLVHWNAKEFPYLMVTHVGEKRSTLIVNAQGGSLELPIRDVPAGGYFELSLSNGINSIRVEHGR